MAKMVAHRLIQKAVSHQLVGGQEEEVNPEKGLRKMLKHSLPEHSTGPSLEASAAWKEEQ